MVMGSEGTLQPEASDSLTKAGHSHGFPAVEDQVKVLHDAVNEEPRPWSRRVICIWGHFEKINKATTSIESQKPVTTV